MYVNIYCYHKAVVNEQNLWQESTIEIYIFKVSEYNILNQMHVRFFLGKNHYNAMIRYDRASQEIVRAGALSGLHSKIQKRKQGIELWKLL